MRYFFAVLFTSLLISAGASAQEDSVEVEKPSLTLAAIYASNANYYGQTAADRLPYILTNASFRLPSGFYVSASAYRLLNLGGSGVSAVDASAGFNWDVTSRLSAGIGYSRSFYPENSPLLQAGNENMASASLGYDWQIFKTDVGADYSFGSQQDMFVSLANSKLIDLGSIGNDKGYFSIEPEFEVVGGTQHYLEEYTVRKTNRDRLIDRIKNPFTPPGQEEETETVTTAKTSFDLLSYNLSLPLGYSRGNYLVEAGYQMSVLGKRVSESQKPHSFFNLSFYYQF